MSAGFTGADRVFDTHLSWIVQEGATPENALRLAWRLEYEHYALVPQERPMLGDDGPNGAHAPAPAAALHHGTRLMGTTHSPGHELSAVGAG